MYVLRKLNCSGVSHSGEEISCKLSATKDFDKCELTFHQILYM